MSTLQERIQVLYEISLTIGPGETLGETVDTALTGYLQKLNCSVGAVLERVEGREDVSYEIVATIPGDPFSDPATRSAFECLPDPEEDDDQFRESLPIVGRAADRSHYYVMDLPGFGVLILGKRGGRLEDATVSALEPLNEKLADACRTKRVEAQLREERNRFEAVFEAIEEPAVSVVFEEEGPIIQRVNRMFEETFGYTAEEARGGNVNELIVPEERTEEAEKLDERAADGETVTKEVQRETTDGLGDFLFRTASVRASDADEHFGLYVDITEEKDRQRKLEQLYRESKGILSGEDREAVCERTVVAAEEILGLSMTGVHLYDRHVDALVPVATTGAVTDAFEGQPNDYTDRESVVWEVYETGEPRLIADVDTFDGQIPGDETPVKSVMILPLGEHGIFIASALESEAFETTDFQLAQLFSALVETALDRATREQGLAGIPEITRAALDADTHEEVAEAVIERMPTVLDFPVSTILRREPGTTSFESLASTPRTQDILTDPAMLVEDDTVWEVLANGEQRLVLGEDLAPEDTDVIGSVLITPVGNFGVLVTGSSRVDGFTPSEQQLAETLASNVETVMRLVSRRQELQLLDEVLARILRHNLRNDLTAIQGFAATIERTVEETPANLAGRIVERCQELNTTVEHAREMRKIVRSRDETATVSIRDAVEHAVAVVRDEFPDADVRVTTDTDARVDAHPAIATGIRHLVENGIRHRPPDAEGQPRVEVTVSETDDCVVVEVTDDGPGIPNTELEILDQHSESALEHGSGAGLWIIDRVVEYSDATLEFETGNGTTATIRFHDSLRSSE